MASPTQMHNVLCRSVTIDQEAMFTASSLVEAVVRIGIGPISNSRVGGALWKALYVQDGKHIAHMIFHKATITTVATIN
jgi:hypothetical protein